MSRFCSRFSGCHSDRRGAGYTVRRHPIGGRHGSTTQVRKDCHTYYIKKHMNFYHWDWPASDILLIQVTISSNCIQTDVVVVFSLMKGHKK